MMTSRALNNTVLCVDLDGTLINSDLLLETFVLLIKRNLIYILMIPIWLLKGKASLKAELAKRINLNPHALPYNKKFLDWLIDQKSIGHELWLCTASNYRLANLIADHLKIFTGVIASDDSHNMSGSEKAKTLVDRFGFKKFLYCGNHAVDLKVWEVSSAAIVVNGSSLLQKKAGNISNIVGVFNASEDKFISLLKALRFHQWVKNTLVFVPFFTAHKLTEMASLYQSIGAFIAFSLCASSVYLLNDMLDLESDRLHARKSRRPFASGKLSLLAGFILSPTLLLLSFLISLVLPTNFLIAIVSYYALTFSYSFYFKQLVMVDIITLAGLYTIRIIAGAAAISVPLSFWLLLFSVFLFFSLALVKRYAELEILKRNGELKALGRGYHVEDLPILHSLGTASGMMAVLVLALYINSPAVSPLYSAPESLWLLCIISMFWVGRLWLKTHRGEMHEDPIVFAMKDKVSLVCGMLSVIATFMAI